MSLQTTLAGAEALYWERKWRDHRQHCPQCMTASRQRSAKNPPCPTGGPIYAAHRQAQVEYASQKQLDKQPVDGQDALF